MSSPKKSRIKYAALAVFCAALIFPAAQSRLEARTTSTPAAAALPPAGDMDDDGVADAIDNCVRVWNPDQAESGVGDLRGDACDPAFTSVTTVLPANLGTKHQTWSGATLTLKAVAWGGVNQYMWDFGDGSPVTAWTAISNPFNLGVNHVYTGPAGVDTDYVATVYVRNSAAPATVYQATFPVVVKDKTLDVQSAMAIDQGLWYLHTTMSRSTYAIGVAPGYGNQYGNWSGVLWGTVAATRAFVAQKHTLTGTNRLIDPYNDTVQRATNYLMTQVTSVAISNQVHGNPDTNANAIGLRGGGDDTYYNGFFLDLVVHLGPPAWTSATGVNANVYGRTLEGIAQDMIDWIAFAQADSGTYRGGWQYTSNSNTADNSTSMYPATGFLAAEEMVTFNLTIPAFVKTENAFWTTVSQAYGPTGGGQFEYQTVSANAADCGPTLSEGWYRCVVDTSSGILQMTMQGVAATDAKIQKAVGFIGKYWGSVMSANSSGGAGLTTYPMYAAVKALRHVNVTTLTWRNGTSFDWYNSDSLMNGITKAYFGIRPRLVAYQAAAGNWSDTAGNAAQSGALASGLAVIMLSEDDYIISATATADAVTAVYDGASHAGTGSCVNSAAGSVTSYQLNGSPIAGAPADAGSYTFEWTCPGDATHIAATDTGTITIAKAPTTTTVTFDAGPYVYSGAAFGATATTIGGTVNQAASVAYTGDCTNVTATDGCTASAEFAGDANHNASSGAASITILKADTTVSLDCSTGAPFTYTGAAITPCVATASGPGTLTGEVSAVSYTNNVNAGTASASASYPGDANHNASAEATATFAIGMATPTVTVSGETVTYDGAPHTGTCAVTGVNADALAGVSSYSPATPQAAGSYTLTCAFAGDGNYLAASGTAPIVINKAAATVTAASGSKVFGTADPALTPSSSGFLPADGITVASEPRDAGENVGSYATHASASGAGIANYTVQYVDGTLEITKATPTVTVAGETVTYDGLAHAGSCSVAGVNGDVLTGTASYAPGSGAPVAAGSYTLTCAFDGNGNYAAASDTATITIGRAAATAVATGVTAIYDAQPHGGSCAVTGLNGDVLTGTASYAPGPGAPVAAGSYTLTCTFDGSANYAPATSSAAISIAQAPLVVKANDVTRNYGVVNPPLTATITGFVGGETEAVLGGALSITTTAGQFSAPGTSYPIVPSGLTAANYAIAFVNGTLTINPNQAPVCTAATPSVSTIWAPNHQWVPVTLNGVTDADGDALTIRVDSIFQDEAVGSGGAGSTGPDGQGIGTSTAQVRAERAGTPKQAGDGRVYHITFTATDTVGQSCSATVTVTVPHDQSGKTQPIDGGALFNSTIAVPKK